MSLMQKDVTDVSVSPRSLQRALGVVMGSAGIHDPAAAEEILHGLARQLDRPLASVVEDLACGREFAGRPGWF